MTVKLSAKTARQENIWSHVGSLLATSVTQENIALAYATLCARVARMVELQQLVPTNAVSVLPVNIKRWRVLGHVKIVTQASPKQLLHPATAIPASRATFQILLAWQVV